MFKQQTILIGMNFAVQVYKDAPRHKNLAINSHSVAILAFQKYCSKLSH